MKDAKHTPGPWTIGPEATSVGHLVYVPIKYGNRNTIKATVSGVTSSVYAHNDRGDCVGKAYTDKFGDERRKPSISADEARANARLIAAAPELLTALEDARGAISDELMACGFDEIKQHPMLKSHERILKRADAALRKARGE